MLIQSQAESPSNAIRIDAPSARATLRRSAIRACSASDLRAELIERLNAVAEYRTELDDDPDAETAERLRGGVEYEFSHQAQAIVAELDRRHRAVRYGYRPNTATEPDLSSRFAALRDAGADAFAELINKEVGYSGERYGDRRKFTCPFHGDGRERTPSLTVYPDGRAHCFGCQWSGDAADFVAGRRGIGKVEALRLLESGELRTPEHAVADFDVKFAELQAKADEHAALEQRSLGGDAPDADPPTGGNDRPGRQPSQSTRLVSWPAQVIPSCFMTPRGHLYYLHRWRSPRNVAPEQPGGPRVAVTPIFRCGKTAPGGQALQDALATLAGFARFDGACHRCLSELLAADHDAIYLDLGTRPWQVVQISADGWRRDCRVTMPRCDFDVPGRCCRCRRPSPAATC